MKKNAIEILLRTEYPRIKVSQKLIKQTILKILRELRLKNVMLSVFLVGDVKMKELNRRYLKHNHTTDVISFGQGKRIKKLIKKSEAVFLGDIVISLQVAKREAAKYGNSFIKELNLYICHGILHLLGYDDKTAKGSKEMQRKQEKILKEIKKI